MAEMLVQVSRLMKENPDISEIDLNPVIWNSKFHVVDPRIIRDEAKKEIPCEPMPQWKETSLDCMFNPKSCAVIGAASTPDEASVSYTISLRIFESFDGPIYLVNNKFTDARLGDGENGECERNMAGYLEHIGKKRDVYFCSDVSKLSTNIDVAIFTSRAETIPKTLRQLSCNSTVIISDGFGEAGRGDLEDELKEIANEKKIAVIGTNCLGIVNENIGTIFISQKRTVPLKTGGNIGIILQSGGLGLEITEHLGVDGVPVNNFVSCGNAKCTTVTDLLRKMGSDEKIKVIGLYLESVTNGVEFAAALKEVCKKKPVVILKGGLTKVGAKRAQSHTGGMTDSIDFFEAACDQAGAYRLELKQHNHNPQILANILSLLATQPRPRTYKVAPIVGGGGIGIIDTDSHVDTGIQLSQMDSETIARIKKLPGMESITPAFPLDMLGSADTRRVIDIVEIVHEAEDVGIIYLLPYLQIPRIDPKKLIELLGEFYKKREMPIIVSLRGDGPFHSSCIEKLKEEGIQYYGDTVVDALPFAIKIWQDARYSGINFRTVQ